MELKPWQDAFFHTQSKYPALVAAWATGKSMTAIMRAMQLSEEYPGNLGMIIRKNYTDLRDSTMKDFERYTGLKVGGDSKSVKLSNGSEILFRHGDEVSVMQNINLGWFWIEQAEELPDSKAFDWLCGRTRREGQVEFRSGFITANVNGHNWVWEMWKNQNKDPQYPLWEAKTADNADVLPADYIESLEGIKVRNPEIYKRCVLNDWEAIAGGRFFDTWSEATHKIVPFAIPAEWERVISLDYGWGAGPSSVGWWAIDYGGKAYRYRELYIEKQTYTELAYQVLIKTGNEKISYVVADPAIWGDRSHHKGLVGESGGETMTAILWPPKDNQATWTERRHRGIPDSQTMGLQQGDNNRITGWGRFREYLAVTQDQHGQETPGMYVFDTCADFLRTIALMTPDEHKPEDLDTGLEDHAMDETRLFLMSRPERPVASQIDKGMTHDQRAWKHLADLRKGINQSRNRDSNDYLGGEG